MKIFRSGLLFSVKGLDHGFIYNFKPEDVPSGPVKDFSYVKTLKQVHSSKVLFFNDQNLGEQDVEGDAMFTNLKSVCLGIYTADCVPVILYDQDSGVICAIHAGWRGTLAEITLKALAVIKDKFSTSGRDTLAVIGPSIGSCCYEVDHDVASGFRDISEEYAMFIEEKNNSKFMLDLQGMNKLQLRMAGVARIESSNICTMCNTQLPSFRRDGSNAGKIFSYIGLV